MRDICVVPSYFRPEYLSLCLEHILLADGGKDKEVWIGQDRHVADEAYQLRDLPLIRDVVASFEGKFSALRYTEREPHKFTSNACNFLELYKAAYATDARYVFLIEDDVHISRDFFRWHEAMQERGNYWLTVGWHCIRNEEVRKSNDPTEYIETTRDYSSIGVCWKRENLASIVKHARPEYYGALTAYLREQFPHGPIPHGQWTEQAGLIMRTLLAGKDSLTVAWPSLRRVSHVGVNGYHRKHGHAFTGTLEQRVLALRLAIAENQINKLSRDVFDDIDGPLHVPDWKAEDLHCVQRFKWNGKI